MTQSMTYDELAERLGITRNAARVLAQRRKWARYTSQEDGKARVRVPEDELDRLGARRGRHEAEHEPPHDVRPAGGEVDALKDHVQTLREMLDLKDAAHAVELERLRDTHGAELERMLDKQDQLEAELQEARAEADHAKSDQVRMARDVVTMFDQLKELTDRQAELHADRARLEIEADRLRAELEQARRPWWRRLIHLTGRR